MPTGVTSRGCSPPHRLVLRSEPGDGDLRQTGHPDRHLDRWAPRADHPVHPGPPARRDDHLAPPPPGLAAGQRPAPGPRPPRMSGAGKLARRCQGQNHGARRQRPRLRRLLRSRARSRSSAPSPFTCTAPSLCSAGPRATRSPGPPPRPAAPRGPFSTRCSAAAPEPRTGSRLHAPAGRAATALPGPRPPRTLGTWETRSGQGRHHAGQLNTYGFAADCNAGPVAVGAPLSVSVHRRARRTSIQATPSPGPRTANGGNPADHPVRVVPPTRRRRPPGPLTSPRSGSRATSYTWTPGAADVGDWEIIVWRQGRNTPANANTYGYAASSNPGPVQVVPPPSPSPSPRARRRPSTATRHLDGHRQRRHPVDDPVRPLPPPSPGPPPGPRTSPPRRWQTSNVLIWTPTSADVAPGTSSSGSRTPTRRRTRTPMAMPPRHAGTVTGLTPRSPSPATPQPGVADHRRPSPGPPPPAAASGRPPVRALPAPCGTTTWIPDVTAPAWQTSNALSWTPAAADVGTWEIFVWVKDGDTPANQNGYGYATSYNPGPVQVVAPLTLSVTPSPESRPHDDTRLITWTATASGGIPATYQYAFFRRRAGATAWIPAVSSRAGRRATLSWDPTARTWAPGRPTSGSRTATRRPT